MSFEGTDSLVADTQEITPPEGELMLDQEVTVPFENISSHSEDLVLLNKSFSEEMRELETEAELLIKQGESPHAIEELMKAKEDSYLLNRATLIGVHETTRQELFQEVTPDGLAPHTETDPLRLMEEVVKNAKRAVGDLGAEGSSAIMDIEQQTGLPPADVEEMKNKIGVVSRLEKIKGEAQELLEQFQMKVKGLFHNEEAPSVTDDHSSIEDKKNRYRQWREHFSREQRENSVPLVNEARVRRDQILEAKGLLQMPKEEYDAYFSSDDFSIRTELSQQNVGDCYAVSAIHALSRSPHFEMICRSSMKRLPDGSWEVKVPLLGEDGEVITISADELLPQRNTQFLKWDEKNKIIPDLRMNLRPVKGKEGLQVLEAAFIKKKFGSVDRLAAEGGWGGGSPAVLGRGCFCEV